MTVTTREIRSSEPSTASSPVNPPTLADEHAELRSQLTARADAVLSAIASGDWPTRELRALTGYYRAELLPQAEAEEWRLFPAHGSPRFTRLSHDHARLRFGLEALERASSPEGTRSPARLASTVRDVLAQLDRHFRAEEQALRETTSASGTPVAAASRRPHEWYPLTEGPVIDLDALPDDGAVDATVERLLRLARGAQVGLRGHRDPLPVWRRLNAVDPGGYGFVYLQGGPPLWSVQVTRRSGR